LMAETATALSGEDRHLQSPALLPKRSLIRELARDKTAVAGLIILIVMFGSAVAAPWIAPHDPRDQDVVNRYARPSTDHLLGTDNLGRDELSRLLHGARVSLFTALAVGVAILVIGIGVGLIAGFAGGFIDGVLMRIVDVLLAFPSLLLALAITGMLGPGLLHLMIGMTAVWWTDYARLVRGMVLSVKERPFVESARALGLPGWRVAVRHILPNMVGPVMVLGTLQTGRLLLALSALSFLGLGVQPPTPEWGAMLDEGQNYLASAPQLMVYPGAAITLSALGFNLLGDGLRDVLDPTFR
jgi:ABC-type dipeptide/oligopeptide/nickel transport system permease subunit